MTKIPSETVQRMLDVLVERGDVYISGVDAETGENIYKLTEQGREKAEGMIRQSILPIQKPNGQNNGADERSV